jgi:23S rRNA U2552 (ribose-2'-O)-methylase RlmE/FtsJ
MKLMNKLENYFFNKKKKLPVHKWHHYFEIYDNHFSRFLNKNPNILEIGVEKGGSLEMWNYYFDGKCNIYGIDIDETCLEVPNQLGVSNIQIDIGDQEDRNFWKQYLKDKPKFDIVIEDGGHTMKQQIVTFEELYDHVDESGIYLCEDLHTSYWDLHYSGGYKKPDTFVEYSKNFIDGINSQHITDQTEGLDKFKKIRETTKSIHYYDSVIVLEKGVIPFSVHTIQH